MYREWQQLGIADSVSVPDQLARWLQYIDLWEKALNTGMEVFCQGDYNLNHCNWTNPNLPRSNQSYKLRSLISVLFNRIFPHGVSQLVSGPTRHFPGQTPSGLDHCFTNAPEKISHIQKFHCGGSYHMVILAVRSSTSIKGNPNYIR